jgi:hypothetical protein
VCLGCGTLQQQKQQQQSSSNRGSSRIAATLAGAGSASTGSRASNKYHIILLCITSTVQVVGTITAGAARAAGTSNIRLAVPLQETQRALDACIVWPHHCTGMLTCSCWLSPMWCARVRLAAGSQVAAFGVSASGGGGTDRSNPGEQQGQPEQGVVTAVMTSTWCVAWQWRPWSRPGAAAALASWFVCIPQRIGTSLTPGPYVPFSHSSVPAPVPVYTCRTCVFVSVPAVPEGPMLLCVLCAAASAAAAPHHASHMGPVCPPNSIICT